MGRLLVRVFLGSCALATVGLVLAFAESVWFIWRTVSNSLSDPSIPIAATPGFPGILLALWLYFFLVLPPLILALLLSGSFVRAPPPGAGVPPSGSEAREMNGPTAVVLTAYNDEASIGQAVDDFSRVKCVSKVIVVDNNSTDRTTEIAQGHGAVVVSESKQGYGYACMAGLQFALKNTDATRIVLAEGDMTFFAEDTKKLLPYLDDCDLVLGTRTTRVLTRQGSQMDWFMTWGNMFLAYLIRMRYWDSIFVGQARLTDVGCTFRAIRRDSLAKIIDRLTVGGHYFSPHMILMALSEHLRVVEVPVKFRERVGVSKGAGGSRKRALGIGFQMLAEIALH